MPIVSRESWSEFIAGHPGIHILQEPAWGELKSLYGWESYYLVVGEIGAQILFQAVPLGYQVAYIPRGPVSKQVDFWNHPDWEQFQAELDRLCNDRRVVFVKIEPDVWESDLGISQGLDGYRHSQHNIQPPRTLLVDLSGTEDEILARMKSKTRYNIRLAAKKDIVIKQVDDVDQLYDLMGNTSDRSDFGIHTRAYYHDVHRLFSAEGRCQIFQADYQGQPLASIMVLILGKRSWYFYGGSSFDHRDKMPTYLVQWEAMRWAKSQGCDSYDLWGVPDQDLDTLEAGFTSRSDGLWGVYRFKRGFGGVLKRASGPWDKVYRPLPYWAYSLRTGLGSE